MNRKASPNVYIIAGPNGSGKTTFAKNFLPTFAKCDNFINADLIASGLSPFSPDSAALKAGRIVLEQIQEYAHKGEDFAFETTLSGKTYLRILRELKNQGYQLHLFFLWIPNIELSLARIRERVSKGGHNVPAADVRRRFRRTVENFTGPYRPLLDSWMIFDNSTERPSLIASQKDGKLSIEQPGLFRSIFKEQE